MPSLIQAMTSNVCLTGNSLFAFRVNMICWVIMGILLLKQENKEHLRRHKSLLKIKNFNMK